MTADPYESTEAGRRRAREYQRRRRAAHPNIENPDQVTVLADPTFEFEPGVKFSRLEFKTTLSLGYWPDGMVIKHGKSQLVVHGKGLQVMR